MYFWCSRDGLEIDLLVNRNSRLYPMEIRAISTLLPGHKDALTLVEGVDK